MGGETLHFTFLIAGDNYVGKSSFLKSLAGKHIDNVVVGSNGGESRSILIGKDIIKALIFDSDGTPEFFPTLSFFIGCSDVIMLLFAINVRQSYENLPRWVDFLKKNSPQPSVVTLVGCGSDRKEHRQVSTEEGKCFAKKNNMNFMETSAVTGDNVESAFRITALTVYAEYIKRAEGNVIHENV